MTPSKVEEYKFFNITTVEQLAGASDAVGQKFFGFSEDKRAANNFIELAKGNAPLVKMNEELKERDAKIEDGFHSVGGRNACFVRSRILFPLFLCGP